jgi:hypothetical protein
MRNVVQSDAPADFWEVTESRGLLYDILFPGDVVVDWKIGTVFDIIRRKSTLLIHTTQFDIQAEYEDLTKRQLESAVNREWSIHLLPIPHPWRKNNPFSQTSIIDPNGRATIFTTTQPSMVLGIMHERTYGVRFRHQVAHHRLWELHEVGTVVAKPEAMEALAIGVDIERLRKKVAEYAPRRGPGIRVLKQRFQSTPWWERLSRQLSTYSPPAIEHISKVVDKPRGGVSTGLDEVDQLLLWSSWPEWDHNEPPFNLKKIQNKKRGYHVGGSGRNKDYRRQGKTGSDQTQE